MCTAGGRVFGSVAEALRVANATMDYLNSPAADLDPAICGSVLLSLGEIEAKFTVAHAARRMSGPRGSGSTTPCSRGANC